MSNERNNILKFSLWFFEGVITGFSAIMPGISGGALCVAFGMYIPIIEMISCPRKNIVKYGKMLLAFAIGAFCGFVGLSGIAGWLMRSNNMLVICAFIGFIVGTFPKLWEDARTHGQNKYSIISMLIAFSVSIFGLFTIKTHTSVTITADFYGFLLCGVLWGLSFIVPGLSSSTILLFFGLYQPMLDGIAQINIMVMLPIAIGVAVCVLLMSRCINYAYKKHYSLISHAIIGVVTATTIMIAPNWEALKTEPFYSALCIIIGAIISYSFTYLCAKIKHRNIQR